jgi:hypothetical protein
VKRGRKCQILIECDVFIGFRCDCCFDYFVVSVWLLRKKRKINKIRVFMYIK